MNIKEFFKLLIEGLKSNSYELEQIERDTAALKARREQLQGVNVESRRKEDKVLQAVKAEVKETLFRRA